VTGTAVSADQGGRDKGKVSLVLTLKSVHLSNGETVAIQTNQVTQEAKSAGDATKMVTRRPAADIPPETVLTFRLANDISITEKVNL
jgi:hypothetical protein